MSLAVTFLKYDETANVEQLRQLPPLLRAMFALLTALRILPAYRRFHQKTGRGDPDVLQNLAELLWEDLAGAELAKEQLQAAVDKSMKLIPVEDDGWDEATQPYAEDAAAAVTYALRARLSGDAQEAGWAARRVYEASDYFASSRLGELANRPDAESTILSTPPVQVELARQRRDLQELAELEKTGVTMSRLQELRARSEREAETFFDALP